MKDSEAYSAPTSYYGKCNQPECNRAKIFDEDYCWEHLPLEAIRIYKEKIDQMILEVISLENANFEGVNFYEANFENADLREAIFSNAKISESNFTKADLSNAIFENARLNEVNFQSANLSGTNFKGVLLWEVVLEGARYLRWDQLDIPEDAPPGVLSDIYNNLREYFQRQGYFEDERKAYYRERLMSKKEAFANLFWLRSNNKKLRWILQNNQTLRKIAKNSNRKWFRFIAYWLISFDEIKRFFLNSALFFSRNPKDWKSSGLPRIAEKIRRRWLGLWFMWATVGFGERWLRSAFWAIGTFVFFGFIYWLGTLSGFAPLVGPKGIVTNLIDCIYFSLVTFVTLGFGDIWPNSIIAKIIVGVEVIFGYVFLDLLVTLIARKVGR